MRKKILVDLLNLASPKVAGVGVFTRNLLTPWLDSELPYDVVFISSAAVDAEKLYNFKTTNNIRHKRVRAKHVLARFIYQQLILPFQLIGCAAYFNPTVGIPFFGKIVSPKTKLIVTIHDVAAFFYPKKYSRKRSALIRVVSRRAALVADHIFTVSQSSKADIIKISGVSPSKISVIYNFINAPFERTNNEDKKYFVCVSTIEPGKNLENTIEGYAIFKKDKAFDEYRFYWVGGIGWVYTEEQVRELIKKNGVTDSFILTGYVSEDEKKDIIRNATAVVYLSHYEGFGLPLLEGMLLNKPAVTASNSSLPEVAGNAAIFCDEKNPGEIARALKLIITERDLRKANIPEQLKKFEPKVQVDTFIETMNNILNITKHSS